MYFQATIVNPLQPVISKALHRTRFSTTEPTGRLLIAFAATLMLTACAIKPLAEWHDSEFAGRVDNILVIGVSDQAVVRRQFEDTFVNELALLGISAKPSYRVLTDEQISSKNALDLAIEAQSMDAVLVSRIVGVEEIETYTPPTYTRSPPTYAHKPLTHPYKPSNFDRYYRNYHSYFTHAARVATPGYWDKYEVLKLETNLYDSTSQQLIWSIQSESFDPGSATQMIDDQISVALESLRKTGLISN